MNQITVTGRLGQNAELIDGERPCVRFSVADSIWDSGKEVTQWTNCTIWDKRLIGLVPVLNKGAAVTVIGDLRLREFKRRDGTPGSALSVTVHRIDVHTWTKGEDAQQ